MTASAKWSNELQFNLELDLYAKAKMPAQLVLLTKRIFAEVARGVVFGTPVREGRARGSWSASHNHPVSGETGRSDKSGGATVAAIGNIMSGIKPFETAYLGSDLPYIIPLEEGHSDQNRGWVKATVHAVNAKFS